MIKVPEYMAMGRAIASYRLPETAVSAGDSAAYAVPATPESLGRCVHELLEDPRRRAEMGRLGRELVARRSWQRSAASLLAAYEWATAGRRGAAITRGAGGAVRDRRASAAAALARTGSR